MKIKIRNIGFLLFAMLLTACSDDFGFADTLSDDGEKTPLGVAALLDVSSVARTTRAADKTFYNGDELLAYLRHVKWNGGLTDADADKREVITADNAPRLVTFTKKDGAMSEYSGDDITPIGTHTALGLKNENTNQTENLGVKYTDASNETVTALYWDDFSKGAKGDATDLRTEGHYLQSYYGYCYNGSPAYGESGSCITTALVEAEGTLGWTINTDQTVENAFQHSDLLWSAEQTPIQYAHASSNDGPLHGKLILPYTHAMSKITINLTVNKEKGFDTWTTDNWTDAAINLNHIRKNVALTAPTYKQDYTNSALSDIKMRGRDVTDVYTKKYDAIVVPSVLSVGNNIATITGIDGNTYTIPITESMLQPAGASGQGWGDQLDEAAEVIYNGIAQAPTRANIEQGTGYQMKPGVNYVLNVTISKAGIQVIALIKDWIDVEAEGIGEILLNADVKSTDKSNEIDINDAQFNLWRLEATGNADATKRTNAKYGEKATTATFDNDNDGDETEDTWVCNPKIYWPNYNTNYYFRALAKYEDGNYKPFNGENSSHASTTDFKVYQGTDLIWGTTAKHIGYQSDGATKTYPAGSEINPRTGEVPLDFEHAMSKITVKLATVEGNAAVTLAGAKLSLYYNYDNATVSLEDGSLSDLGYKNDDHYSLNNILAANDVTSGTKLSNVCVVPQNLTKYLDGGTEAERKAGVVYYQESELQVVNGKSYVKISLGKEHYTNDEIIEHNSALTGAKKAGDVKEMFSYSEYHNRDSKKFLSDPDCFLPITQADYNNLPESAKTKPAVYYTQEEIDAAKAIVGVADYTTGTNANAELVASKTTSDVKVNAISYAYSEYVSSKLHLPLTESDFNSLSTESKTKSLYTEATANAYNKTLPDAYTETTVKLYYVIDGSIPATTDTVKETTGFDNIIRLGITLADGTTYSLAMTDCIEETTGTKITEWERGKHYVYTITLSKAKITFRALIKDWNEARGYGEATLDW